MAQVIIRCLIQEKVVIGHPAVLLHGATSLAHLFIELLSLLLSVLATLEHPVELHVKYVH